RVCPTSVLCEGACVLMDRDEKPIKIGRLQRYATDPVLENRIQVLEPCATSSGKKVALIGGGPASLGCAAELARLGHQAVIFEKMPYAGGLNTYGIAYYKLTPEVSLREIELIKRLGVEFRCGVEVGKDIAMDEIHAEFDAVFLGLGLGKSRTLDIPGENLPEVMEALDFIESFHVNPLHEVALGQHVVVLGCGNTAIDAVTQAKRLGAESATIVYRRGEADMPAYAYEYDIAKTDGCDFIFYAAPIEVLGSDAVRGLRLIRTRPDGKGGVEAISGSEFTIPCDMLLKAVGQDNQAKLLKTLIPALALDRAGRIETEAASGKTSVDGVYAGGDARNGGREVVNAVAEGKKAARSIHKAFTGETVEGPTQSTRLGTLGKPVGSGFDAPVRVPEMESAYITSGKGQ
ncbi:MAG: FAD-dependent oxidoreductase, partial [Verrucomicrobia bacterium]|nr:FAD-dependent oxidoreductase [Verrucomicrobiota bacterium]